MNFPKPADLSAAESETAVLLRVHAVGIASGENYPADFATFRDLFGVLYLQNAPADAPPGTPPTPVSVDRIMVTRRK